MTLPLLLSVPHAGLEVPPEVQGYCALTPREVTEDGDMGAREIYALDDQVDAFVTTEVARAIVDQNRAESDRGKDGVVKTHTCWDVPVYDAPPPENVLRGLIDTYWKPYHRRLEEYAGADLLLGVDCHTMAATGPPVGPDPGRERPAACLSHAGGTCPDEWLARLARHLERTLERPVALNEPFRGGYIIRTHARRMPWVQIELSRAPFLGDREKRGRVMDALTRFCAAT